nr:hypothetical protein [uncultured archaeon]
MPNNSFLLNFLMSRTLDKNHLHLVCGRVLEHPKNKGLHKPHLLRCGALVFLIKEWGISSG